MDISHRGLDLIKKWEAFYAHAYDDGEGVWTIGWGTIRWDLKTPVKKGDVITREEAERQLRKELQRVEDAVDSAVRVPLSQHEFDCLCSFGYNVGIGWITGIGHAQATFIKRLNAGHYDAVPAGLMRFTRGANSGKHYAGLLNRRKDEVRLWLAPDAQPIDAQNAPTETEHFVIPAADGDSAAPAMPQAVAPVSGSMKDAAQSSWTIRGAAAGIVGALIQAWDWAFSTAKDAGAEIVAISNAKGPFDALLTAAKANMGMIAAGIVLTGCTIAIVRRLQAARQMKEG